MVSWRTALESNGTYSCKHCTVGETANKGSTWFNPDEAETSLPLSNKPFKEESTTGQIEGSRERVNTADGDDKVPWLL